MRDDLVTGVETCALPILGERARRIIGALPTPFVLRPAALEVALHQPEVGQVVMRLGKIGLENERLHPQIGRASCRERVYIWEVVGYHKKGEQPGHTTSWA